MTTRRRTPAWLLLLVIAIAGLLLAGGSGCGRDQASTAKYYCPMHPSYVVDHPGDCPICNMKLVPVPDTETTKTAGTYACPMHPEVVSDHVERCPKCGMDLELVKTADPGVSGMAPVDLTGAEVKLAGVQTAIASMGSAGREIVAPGIVQADETRVRVVNVKVGGYIERLMLTATGQAVREGEEILEIYSPELLAGQEEYLSARAALARLGNSPLPEARESATGLLSAARRRLELFDVPASFMDRLDSSGQPARTVSLAAQTAGFVTVKDVREGSKVEPGMPLYTVTDLSRVWVEAPFFEQDAQFLKRGARATIRMTHGPDRTWEGSVSLVLPALDPETRTVRARFEIDNRDLFLRPGMYAEVSLSLEGTRGVIVPADAVMDTGQRQIVFVEVEEGRFVPREVTVARRAGGQAELSDGVAEGERVVIKANFLLDSESRIRAALSQSGAAPAAHAH